MATTSTPPPVKAEHVLKSPSGKINSKLKLQDTDTDTNTNTNSLSKDTPENDHNQPPHFINTVAELRGLSTSLSTFQRRYDDLQGHLDYIRTTIESKLPKEISTISTIPPPEQLAVISSTETLTPNAAEKPADNSEEKPNSMKLALEALCVDMCGRGLRKYISTQLSNASQLREEVPKALKCAPNPAKLVLDCIGRFYLQGSNAYGKGSQMNPIREAAVLALECFLRMGVDGVEIEPAVKEEADTAAEAWRKRLKDEGGIPKACELDARGLLFLISGFGIPRDFKHEPLRDLIRASNPNGIYGVLRRSSSLIAKIPGVLERMVRDKKHLGAVNMAYTFEVESFQLPVLKAFLREMEEVWIKARDRGAYTPLAVLNKANRIWVNNMRSVAHCLKQKKLDHSKLLHEWKIDEKISSLEKEIAEIDQEIKEKETEEKAKPKRKADKMEPSNKSKAPKVKHSQHIGNVPQQQKVAAYAARRNAYDGPTHVNYLDGGFPGHISGYSASPSMLRESVAGSLPGNIAAVHGGMVVDMVGQMMNHNSQPYGWHGDAALSERLVGPTFAGQPSSLGFNGLYRRPSPPLEGFMGMPNHPSLEGFAGLPDHRSFQGFAGLPDHPSERVSGRSSASDLYQFADSVVEMELNRSGGSSRAGGGTMPAHQKYNS